MPLRELQDGRRSLMPEVEDCFLTGSSVRSESPEPHQHMTGENSLKHEHCYPESYALRETPHVGPANFRIQNNCAWHSMKTENGISIHRKTSEPCRGCIHKCLAIHPLSSSNKFSFFKLMLGNFSSFLEIPLKCSNQTHSQACKDAILEGPSGRLWHVILCCTGASSCFKDGWEKFVSDNSIEIEDTVVFRHVSNARFAVQIFGSNGYEKRGASAVESCGVCQFKNRDPSTICTPRKCYHKEENIEPSVCLGNSFNVGQRRNQGAEIKDRRKISSVGDVKEVGKTLARSIPSKRTKADIVQASYAETCISNDKFVVLDNHIPFSPSKTSDVDAVVLTTAKSSTSRNAVGLSAEEPIILDGEEEIDTGALPAHEYVRATAAACGHTALEVPQRKSSLCTAVIAPMKQENVLELPSTKRANQRNDIIQGAEPKFSLVLCRSAVSSSFWLSLPVHVGRGYFKPNDDVLLLSQKDEWQATFKNYGRYCGLKGGWRQFVMDNKLKQGDTCVFELINRINHVLKVDILRADKMDNHAKRKGIQEE